MVSSIYIQKDSNIFSPRDSRPNVMTVSPPPAYLGGDVVARQKIGPAPFTAPGQPVFQHGFPLARSALGEGRGLSYCVDEAVRGVEEAAPC